MKYELTTIVADEAKANPAADLVTKHGGQILREESLGSRRFAYPITKLTNGVYARFLIEVAPTSVHDLDNALRREATIVRHLLVLQPRESIAPEPRKVEMSDEQIDAIGDVKEMQAAEEKAKLTKKLSDEATKSDAIEKELTVEAKPTPAVATADTAPAEEVTTADHAAVKDESGVDQATREAALDEKLKSILGK